VGQRSGLGLVEVTILDALAAAGAAPGGQFVTSARVLAAVEERIGLAPGYGYQVLIDLALAWRVPVPLVNGCGNFGGRDGDPPANWRYTEVRLSPAGQVVLAAERGEIAPVPVGLINGSTHQGGTRPPFRPAAVIDAIRQVAAQPTITGGEITAIVGAPDFMTGCAVTGDLDGLAAGLPVDLLLQARVTISDDTQLSNQLSGHMAGFFLRPELNRALLVIDSFPPYVDVSDAARAIADRVREPRWAVAHPGLNRATRLSLRDVWDVSASDEYRIVCLPEPGASLQELRRQLGEIWGVRHSIRAALPTPLGTMLRDWVSAGSDEDLPASLAALTAAIDAGQPDDSR
jgi:hypothetical protein